VEASQYVANRHAAAYQTVGDTFMPFCSNTSTLRNIILLEMVLFSKAKQLYRSILRTEILCEDFAVNSTGDGLAPLPSHLSYPHTFLRLMRLPA
jgi:hypothetical protein